eukprot:3786348-Rhodomonas_salina.2
MVLGVPTQYRAEYHAKSNGIRALLVQLRQNLVGFPLSSLNLKCFPQFEQECKYYSGEVLHNFVEGGAKEYEDEAPYKGSCSLGEINCNRPGSLYKTPAWDPRTMSRAVLLLLLAMPCVVLGSAAVMSTATMPLPVSRCARHSSFQALHTLCDSNIHP